MQNMKHELGWEMVLVGRLKPALRRLDTDRVSIYLKM